jgi:hypothetical protein
MLLRLRELEDTLNRQAATLSTTKR